MRLRASVLFIFLTALVARGDSIEGRMNRAAFPLSRYAAKYEPIPKSIEAEIRGRMGQALDPIRFAPASWFRSSFGIVPKSIDRRRILESVLETEIWKCSGGECRGCPGDEPLGCVMASKAMGGVGVVALIHPCLIGEGKCPRDAAPDSAAWIEKIIASVAFHKAGIANENGALRKAQKASSRWIAETSASINRILGACPGPYPIESKKFLLTLDSLSEPNPAVKTCGEKYLSELRSLPKKCPKIRSLVGEEWDAFAKRDLEKSIEIYRCDAYCRKLLCRTSSAKTIFTGFSGKSVLFLADGACEGKTPLDLDGFLRSAVPKSLRPKLERYGCL